MQSIALPLGPADIAALIPHSGAMRLIDRVDTASEEQISCVTSSHLSPDNPLRSAGRLPVSAALEYAAQAMAIHAALTREEGGAPRRGFLVVASGVAWTADRLDAPGSELRVHAIRLATTGSGAQYSFTLTAGRAVEVTGTLTLQLETI
jgi:predicted hotdog family 3-hydroxylacyl-ACP dehydratase